MGIFGKLLGSDKVIKGGMDLIDNAFHTDEEKAEEHKVFLKLYEPFKVAQRYLALIFSIPFAAIHFIAFGLRLVFWQEPDIQAVIAAVQADMNESLGLIVLTIVGFYFFGGAAESTFKRFGGKK